MKDVLGFLAHVPTLSTVLFGMGILALIGFAPMFTLRLILLVYPPDDDRRRELLAELYTLKRTEQMWWVGQQAATMLFDGVPARIRYMRRRRTEREPSDIVYRRMTMGEAEQIEIARVKARITERELQILGHLASGMTAVAIARTLCVSPRTVCKHLENAYSKLQVHDRMQAVEYCRRHQLL